ncbi:DUF6662 family protein [Methyloradius palustris]|uniref:Uncharacterized protein n=1 Tax=Methyloradius palustris TaxID=2778876 RepID=A0A8D5G5Z6_9PROT|nr:DUF6662 family protein [Methyloradius palustris]BCM23931.1 hypothetical protein ZMTM_01900 [Methyloradius palustris]
MAFLANTKVKLASLLAALLIFSTPFAYAGEGVFGWVYTLDIQPKGKWEFEQKVDRSVGQASGSYALDQFRSEIEYGLTDDIQIAAYVNMFNVHANRNYINPDFCPNVNPCTAGFGVPGSYNDTAQGYNSFGGVDGYSGEIIWRITNPLTSPVGVGIYFEPTIGKLQDSIEARLMLQSNFLDDKLILAGNLSFEAEKEHYTPGEDEIIRQSHTDILYGASYRFAPNWSGGLEGRLHNDFYGYHLDEHIQFANFIGPNVHYAAKDFWVTAAWRYQIHGVCMGAGTGDCNSVYDKVSDDHGRNQFIVRVGVPF